MYGMANFAQTFGEPLGDLKEAVELWTAVYLLKWIEEGFYGRDLVFHHCGR